jgi:hypothetical protein
MNVTHVLGKNKYYNLIKNVVSRRSPYGIESWTVRNVMTCVIARLVTMQKIRQHGLYINEKNCGLKQRNPREMGIYRRWTIHYVGLNKKGEHPARFPWDKWTVERKTIEH